MATIKSNFTRDSIMSSSLRNKSNSVKNEFYLNLGKTIVKDDGSEVFYKFGGIIISIDNIAEIKNTSGNEDIDFANTFVEYLRDQMDSLEKGSSVLIPQILYNCVETQLFRAGDNTTQITKKQSESKAFGVFKDATDDTHLLGNTPLEVFSAKGIKYFYHITHFSNVKNILENDLLPHNNNLAKERIDNQAVNNRRNKRDPIYNLNLHEYVPFYINPKNPMLCVQRQSEIVILAFSLDLLLEEKCLLTDGNAANSNTKFFKPVTNDILSLIDWDIVNADYWYNSDDGKRKRMAELLIPKTVNTSYLKKFYCYDQKTKDNLSGNNGFFDIEINKKFYFERSFV